MTEKTNAIQGRIDIHKGDLVCFIKGIDWLELDDPPVAEMWTDRENRVWAGMQADDLINAVFLVDVPLRDFKFIEVNGVGNGWLQNLLPMVFEDGLHLILKAKNDLQASSEKDEPKKQTPQPGIM